MADDMKLLPEQDRKFTLNFGPQHPAAHGVLRMVMDLDGELVTRIDSHIGLLHRGTEKLLEYKTYLQGLPYFDRLHYSAPMNQEHAWCLAIEKMLGLEVPRRASFIRVLYCEIGRILEHLLNVGTFVMDAGALTPITWAFEQREILMGFYERASGSRLHAAYFRPGGVHQDISQDLIDDIMAFCEQFPKAMENFEGLVTENRIFKQRNVNIGVVTEKTVMEYGFSGVMARGSGLPWDLRRSQPYEIYSEIPQNVFPVIIGKNGDNYDRYVCRMEEMQVSNEIMKWCIENMPKGPVMAEGTKVTPPRRGEMKNSMEALIHHFKLYTEGFHVPAGEVYAAVEAPAGEFGVYLVADGTNPSIPRETARAELCTPCGDGSPLPGPPTGRRIDHSRVSGYCFW